MLRIQCGCGKFLKVAETLVGKKVKCPACAEVVLVKAAATDDKAAPARPPSSSKSLVDHAPQVAPVSKKLSTSKAGVVEAPRKTKPVTKDNPKKKWLLAGGGAAAFLVLASLGVWFLFFRGGHEEVKPLPPPPTVAIQFFVPHQKGDRREVTVNGDINYDKVIQGTERLPQEMQAAFPKKQLIKENFSINGLVRTLEVNAQGEETKVEVTVNKFVLQELGDKLKYGGELSGKEGTILVGTRAADRVQWSGSISDVPADTLELYLGLLVANNCMEAEESQTDKFFGTDQKQPVAGTWAIRKEGVTNQLKNRSLLEDAGNTEQIQANAHGQGKLVKVSTLDDKSYLDVEFNIDATQKEREGTATIKWLTKFSLPGDGSTGPVKKTEKRETKTDSSVAVAGGQDRPSVKLTVKEVKNLQASLEIKYLENVPIEEPPPTQEKKEIAAGPPPPGSGRLSNIKVEWLSQRVGGNLALKVSADYAIPPDTKFKPEATYCLSVQYPTAQFGLQLAPGELRSGRALPSKGNMADPSVVLIVGPVEPLQRCNLILWENVGKAEKIAIATQMDVSITGVPPALVPPTPDAVEFALSKGKAERLDNKKIRFAVDYKLTNGKIDPAKTYRLLVNLDVKKGKQQQVKLFEFKGDKLVSKDKITKDIDVTAPLDTNFEMLLTEATDKSATGTTVSNLLNGQLKSIPKDTMPLNIQIVNAAAARIASGKAKVAPQTFQFQFQWSVVAGQLNPQATYTLVVNLKGGKKAVGPQPLLPAKAGTDFPATGNYNNILPWSGENSFEVTIMELVPGQPKPTMVSNVAKGKIQ